ncbi:cytochrome B561 [Roseivivax marinus]|uniref:Cytochrome B561 n=1 Tax=Roseivivax marinus TaxID=1379903 RepID=W4HRW0_9RHOB|nr:cytochrome b [Roseivivax marinus]ETW14760.1 cytochrome B561 [Roseivivax marinus]
MDARDPVYTSTARAFHWLTAIVVIAMIAAGAVMIREGLPRPVQNTLFVFHKNVGTILWVVVLLRLAYRASSPPPPLPDSVPAVQRAISRVVHGALYALLILMPIAGYVRVRAGGFPIEWLDALGVPVFLPKSEQLAEAAKTAHFYGAWAISLIAALHIAAALYHGIVRRDGVLTRMWPALAPRR